MPGRDDAGPVVTPADYDSNPARFRHNVEATARYSPGDVHADVAARIKTPLDLTKRGMLVYARKS